MINNKHQIYLAENNKPQAMNLTCKASVLQLPKHKYMKTKFYQAIKTAVMILLLSTVFFYVVNAQTAPAGVGAKCEFWLKADAGVTTSNWVDQTSNAHFKTGGGGSITIDADAYNFNPTTYWNNNSYFYYGSDEWLSGSTSAEVFCVLESPNETRSDADYPFFFGGNYTVNTHYTPYTDGNSYVSTFTSTGSNSNRIVYTPSVAANDLHIYNVAADASNWITSYDGQEDFTQAASLGLYAFSTGMSGQQVLIGAAPYSTYYGNISEIILFSEKLDATERAQVNSYLAIKYGISLTSNYLSGSGAAVWASGTGYDNHIFGIAYDTQSGLNQLVSQAKDSKGLTVSTNTDFSSSNATARTALTDGDYLIFGSNSAIGSSANINSTTNVPTGYDLVSSTIWRVQNTGVDQTVYLNFNDLNEFSSPNLECHVLYSTVADFSSNVTDLGQITDAEFELQSTYLASTITTGYITLAAIKTATLLPGGVAGSMVWLRADSAYTSTQWKNITTGTQYTVNGTPATADSAHNFNPGITFDGSNDYIDLGDGYVDFTQGFKSFAVVDPSANTSWERFYDFGNDSYANSITFGRYSNYPITGRAFTQLTDGNNKSFTTDGITNNIDKIYSVYIPSGTPASTVTGSIYANNASTSGSLYVPEVINRTNCRIGATCMNTANNLFKGDIPEFILFNRELTETENMQVNTYLAVKYGLTLETTSNYLDSDGDPILDVVNYSGYKSTVFGIGRDSLSGLHQRISQSVEDGAFTVSTDDNFTNKNDNHAPIAKDKQFLMFASNGGSYSANNSDVTGNYNSRINKVWRCDTTGGFSQDIYLEFDGYGESNDAIYYLFRSKTGDFSVDGELIDNLPENGVVPTHSDTLAGYYFTLYYNSVRPGGYGTNLYWWLKADNGTYTTTNGATCNGWNDKSGNGFNLYTRSGSVVYYDKQTNFNPSVVYYTGQLRRSVSNWYGFGNSIWDTRQDVVYVVARGKSGILIGGYYEKDITNYQAQFWLGTSQVRVSSYWTGSGTLNFSKNYSSDFSDGLPDIVSYQRDDRGHANFSCNGYFDTRENGVSANYNYRFPSYNSHLCLGGKVTKSWGKYYFTDQFYGTVCEVIVYDKTCFSGSDKNHQKIESYLAIKYGITLHQTGHDNVADYDYDYIATDGSVTWDASDAHAGANNDGGDFINNVFGLAHNAKTGLDQRVSGSLYDKHIYAALENNFDDSNVNDSRTVAFNNDLQFMVFSDNGKGAILSQYDELPPTLEYKVRTPREWRIQFTDNFKGQGVYLQFPNYKKTKYTNYAVLVSDDADFSNALEVAKLDADGIMDQIVDFTQFDGATGDGLTADSVVFITVAATQLAPGGVYGEMIWTRADMDAKNSSGVQASDGEAVTAWKDVNRWNEYTGNNGPVLHVADDGDIAHNYNPGVTFDGSNDYFDYGDDDYSDYQDFTNGMTSYFISNRGSSGGGYARFFDLGNGSPGNNIGFGRYNGTQSIFGQVYSGSSSTNMYSTDANETVEGRELLASYLFEPDGGSSTVDAYLYKTGEKLDASLSAVLVPPVATRSQNFMGRSSWGDYWGGDLPEGIIYNWTLSDTQKVMVNTYLAVKYGFPLDTCYINSDTVKVWDITKGAAATHRYGIFGLAHDSITVLDQRISTGAFDTTLTISMANNFVKSNLDSTTRGKTLKNLEYFLIGHDKADSLFAKTDDMPDDPRFNVRMSREYFVQTNIPAGELEVYLKFKGKVFNSKYTYYLLSSTSDDFEKDGVVEGELDANFEYHITLKDSMFYTVATKGVAPGGVGGYGVWYRADYLTTLDADDNLSDWGDMGFYENNAYNAENYNSVQWDDAVINFNPSVNSGAGGWEDDLRSTDNVISQEFYVVAYHSKETGLGGLLGYKTDIGLRVRNSTNGTYRSDQAQIDGGETMGANDWTYGDTLRINGYNRTYTHKDRFNIVNARRTSPFDEDKPLYLGGYYNNSRSFFGEMPEVVSYPYTRTAEERQRIETYLAVKYGFHYPDSYLATDSTVIWDAATLAAYHHEVFGLGLDSIELLDQRISTSYEPNSILTVSLVDDFTSSNTDTTARKDNAFDADIQYIMFGHDGQSTDAITTNTEVPESGNFNARITREWLVKMTNITSKDVYMQFKGYGSTGSQVYYAIVDDDKDGGDFTDATQWVKLDNNGKTAEALTISDSSYITLATVLSAPGGVYSAFTNGIKYTLYSGYDNDLSDGIGGSELQTGYINSTYFTSVSTLPFFYRLYSGDLSLKLETSLKISTGGTYYFRIKAGDDQTDNDLNFYIDTDGDGTKNLAISHTYSSSSTTFYRPSASGLGVDLDAGYHEIELLHANTGPTTKLFFEWSRDGSSWETIPDSLLYTNVKLTAWHKADAGINLSNDESFSSFDDNPWYDQSANGHTMRPHLRVNGYPKYFSTSLDSMVNYNPNVIFKDDAAFRDSIGDGFAYYKKGRTSFAVTKKAPTDITTAFKNYISDYGNNDYANNMWAIIHNSPQLRLDIGTNTTQGSTSDYQNDGAFISTVKYEDENLRPSGSTAPYIWLDLNAKYQYEDNSLDVVTRLNNQVDNQYCIGMRVDESTWGYHGSLPEVIQYPWALDSVETRRVESYLAIKYGSTLYQCSYLASDNTVTWDTTGVALAYSNDIFGIGQDVASALDQRISKSQNDGSVAAIALQNDFTHANTDTTNRNVKFDNDIQFMVLGSNGVGLNFLNTAPLMPTAMRFSARMEREWYVQATDNFDQTVYMQFEGCESTNAKQYYMVVDTNKNTTVITDATQFILLDEDGVTTEAVSLETGDYVSVAMRVIAPGGVVGESIWYRADKQTDVTTEGAAITYWTDVSDDIVAGNAEPAKSGAAYYKSTVANFNPSLDMDAAWRTLLVHNDGTTTTTAQEFYVVSQFTAVPTNGGLIGFNRNDATEYGIRLGSDGQYASGTGSAVWHYHTSGADNYIFVNNKQGERAHNKDIHIVNSIRNAALTDDYLFIGGYLYGYSGRAFTGNMCEVIAYPSSDNNDADNADRLKINTYLGIKYGVTLYNSNYLATDSTTVWNTTAGGGNYNNDIFGLCRDDFELLNQRISKSINDTTVLTLSLDNNFTASNIDTAVRKTEFAQDVAYIVMGSDDASVAFSESLDMPIKYDARMTREWMVQSTDTTEQAVYMQFDSCHSSVDTLYYVLVSTKSDDFTAATTLIALDSTGVTKQAVVLTDSTFVTVAYKIPVEALGGVLWLKADDGTTETMTAGDKVGYWEDRSGQANDVMQTDSAYMPVISDSLLNFNPTVQFTAANATWMDIPDGIVDTSSWRSFSVIRGGAANTCWMAMGDGSTEDPAIMHMLSSTTGDALSLMLMGGNDGTTLNFDNGYLSAGSPAVLITTSDVKDSTRAGVNGFAQLADSADAKGSPYYFTLGAFDKKSGMSNFYDGEIAEVIWFCATDWKEDSEKEHIIESYLALKYGFTLDSGRIDYLSGDTVTVWSQTKAQVYLDNYNQNIFGIARDTLMGLHQKVSKSLNDEAIVTASIDGDFSLSNVSASRTDSVNYMVYDVFADNGDSAQWTGDNAPDSFFVMQRTWQVQETNPDNTKDSIYFQFDVNDADFDVPELISGSSYYVVIDTDVDSLLSDETPIKLTETSAGIWAMTKGVDLKDKAIFTLATKTNRGPGGVTGGLMLWARADKGVAMNAAGSFMDTWTDFSNGLTYTASDSVEVKDTTYNFNPGVLFMHDSVYVQLPDGYANFTQGMENFSVLKGVDITEGLDVFYPLRLDVVDATSYRGFQFGAAILPASPYYIGYITQNNLPVSIKAPEMGGCVDFLLGTRSQGGVIGSSHYADLAVNLNTYSSTSSMSSYTTLDVMDYKARTNNYIGYTTAYSHFGSIPEVIMYNRELDSISRLKVNSYLALKYGITLDSGSVNYLATDSTLMWSTTTANNVYIHNIFGIGRDDVDSLYQRISKSVDTTAIVTLSLSDDFVSPNDTLRTAVFANDLTFQTISNNNGTNTWGEGSSAPFGYTLLTRQWMVQEKGNALDSVYVAFDVDDAEFDVPDVISGEYMMIVDVNGDGSFEDETPVRLTSDASNSSLWYAKYNFADGDVFTLVSGIVAPGGVSNDLQLWLRADRGINGFIPANIWTDFFNGKECTVQGAKLELLSDSSDYLARHNFNTGVTFTNQDTVVVYSGFNDFTGGLASFVVALPASGELTDDFFSLEDASNSNKVSLGQSSADLAGYSGNISTHAAAIDTTVDKIYGFNIPDGAENASVTDSFNVNGLYPEGSGVTVPYKVDRTNNMISGGAFVGDIPEIIIYKRNISAIERRKVDSYLALKYGLTLSDDNNGNSTVREALSDTIQEGDYLAGDTTIIWDASTYSAYHNRIFGIGTDYISFLYQSVSRSALDTIVVMATDADFISSNMGGRTTLADSTFVLTGDNGAGTGFTATFDGKSNTRMARAWVFDVTGTVDSVYLAIPKIAFPQGRTPAIVLSTGDDTFDASDEVIELNEDGTYYWVRVKPADGVYYTFYGILNSVDMKSFMRHGKFFRYGKEQPMQW